MNAALRRALSALGLTACVAVALAGAGATLISLREASASIAELARESDDLTARERRLAPPGEQAKAASPFFEARTVTLAGATLQQRLESAIASAKGRLVSSKVDVEQRDDERRLALVAELTIAEDDMQTLLFDLETGRPYLFVEALEARAPEGKEADAMRVSLTVSGRWSGAK